MMKLFPVDLVVIARNGHPRIKGNITQEHILGEDHIMLNLERGKLQNAEKVNLKRRDILSRICITHNLTTAIRTVAETDCIAYVPRAYAQYAAPIFNLQILPPPNQLTGQAFHLVWPDRSEHDPAHQWLRQIFIKTAMDIRKTVFENSTL